eukprot:GILK01000193.1.p1 GENE.GILK01000193.1~~GILK01000193.1.p1  ORF type:complete len:251 (+),score=39.73 GILK01000193.1:50-754(+)
MKVILVAFALLFCVAVAEQTATPRDNIDDLDCDVCKRMSFRVENILYMNSSEVHYKQTAAQLCRNLPTTDLIETCIHSLGVLHDDVFKCLIQKSEFNSLCADKQIGVCRVPARFRQVAECFNMASHPTSCASCSFVVEGLFHYLNNTGDGVVRMLATACKAFEGVENEKCQALVASYGFKFVHLLIQRISPKQFCCDLGLCEPSIQISDQAAEIPVLTPDHPEIPIHEWRHEDK